MAGRPGYPSRLANVADGNESMIRRVMTITRLGALAVFMISLSPLFCRRILTHLKGALNTDSLV
jgi:hypothetical protein